MKDLDKLENPQYRRAIVVLKSSDYEIQRMDKKSNKYFDNEEILVLDLSDRELRDNELYKKLYKDGLLSNGNVLLQNPYDWDRYSISNNSSPNKLIKSNAFEKCSLFIDLCGYLGAEQVNIKRSFLKNKNGIYSFDITADKKLVSTKAKISSELENITEDIIELQRKYKAGNTLDTSAAKNFLEKNHLINDTEFYRLVNIMETSHQLEEDIYNISLTSETTNILKVASQITLPTWGLKGDFEKQLKMKEEIKLSMYVKFY